MFRVDIGMGYGKWEFTDDATGTYRNSDGTDATYNYALKDLLFSLHTGGMIGFILIGLLHPENFLMVKHLTECSLG